MCPLPGCANHCERERSAALLTWAHLIRKRTQELLRLSRHDEGFGAAAFHRGLVVNGAGVGHNEENRGNAVFGHESRGELVCDDNAGLGQVPRKVAWVFHRGDVHAGSSGCCKNLGAQRGISHGDGDGDVL